MLYRNCLIFAVVLATGGILARPAMSAPFVKKIGVATNNTQTNVGNDTSAKTSATPQQRAPSLRVSGSATESGPKGTGDSGSASSKMTGTANSARLSGLHGNLVKGIGSKLSSNYPTPQPVAPGTPDLTQRVIDLESEMATKQEILEPGDGIDIKGNTISVSEGILALPGQMDGLAQEIDDLNDKFDAAGLSDDYYTIAETEAYLEQNYYTQQYLDVIISQLSNPNVVNHFDPGFLHQGQTQNPKGQI